MKLDFGLFTLSVSGNPLVGNKIWLEFSDQSKYELLKEQKNKLRGYPRGVRAFEWVAFNRNLNFNGNSYSTVVNWIDNVKIM